MNNYVVIYSKGEQVKTNIALHPGKVLGKELKLRGIRPNVFAKISGMRSRNLDALLQGNIHITADVALKLERLLNIPAEFWMHIQVYYDLYVERNKK